MTEAALIGAGIGLVLGIADFFILGFAADRMGGRNGRSQGSRIALNVARISQLIFFPVIGWFAGPVLASNMGT